MAKTQALMQLVIASGSANRCSFVGAIALPSLTDAGYSLRQGWSYRSMEWITHNDHGTFMARGVHGQALYIDPTADMVIARIASHPVAGNAAVDPMSWPAYVALADYLMNADP